MPPISYSTVPGLTTAAQYSGSPLPLPMRVSKGIEVIGLWGKTRMYKPAFGAQVLLGGDTAGLDRLRADPAALHGLQAEVAEDDAVAAGGVTSYTSSLAFSVLDPLWHQRHRSRPRYTCLG